MFSWFNDGKNVGGIGTKSPVKNQLCKLIFHSSTSRVIWLYYNVLRQNMHYQICLKLCRICFDKSFYASESKGECMNFQPQIATRALHFQKTARTSPVSYFFHVLMSIARLFSDFHLSKSSKTLLTSGFKLAKIDCKCKDGDSSLCSIFREQPVGERLY